MFDAPTASTLDNRVSVVSPQKLISYNSSSLGYFSNYFIFQRTGCPSGPKVPTE